jgi:ribosomal protein S18 acetylase RimI-like enzyme
MEQGNKAVLREVRNGSDHAFLYSTWRNALWFAEKRDPKDADQFYKDASEKITAILKNPEALVKIACLADDPDMLLGWTVSHGTHLKFVYVKIDYRGKGIGRLLTKGFKTFDEPQTKIGKAIAEKLLKEKHGREERRKEETETQPD